MGGEQTSCLIRNTAGLETEIINSNNSSKKKLLGKIHRNNKFYNSKIIKQLRI